MHALDDASRPIAVIGAGTMGRQIAAVLAGRGVTVRLYDVDATQLERAAELARSEAPALSRPGDRLAVILAEPELGAAVADARLVIEAAPEQVELKRQLFARLDNLAPADAVLGTNSSSFKSRLLADAVSRPERLLNVHFYNGLRERPAVELMSCGWTAPDLIAALAALLRELGLVPFVARQESTGFIYNRIWAAIKREALAVVAEGVATPEEVDRIWALINQADRRPFLAMDRNGLDVILAIEEHYAAERPELPEEPRQLLKELIAQGKLGVKSGEGFYRYASDE